MPSHQLQCAHHPSLAPQLRTHPCRHSHVHRDSDCVRHATGLDFQYHFTHQMKPTKCSKQTFHYVRLVVTPDPRHCSHREELLSLTCTDLHEPEVCERPLILIRIAVAVTAIAVKTSPSACNNTATCNRAATTTKTQTLHGFLLGTAWLADGWINQSALLCNSNLAHHVQVVAMCMSVTTTARFVAV